jgi:hypothetical protein
LLTEGFDHNGGPAGLPLIFAPFEEEAKISKKNRRPNQPPLLAVQTQIIRHHRAIGRDHNFVLIDC